MTSASPSKEPDSSVIYHHESLNGQPQYSIRLLTIQPGCTNLINCTLTVAHLDEQPRYRALSYMWGTEAATNVIIINQRLLNIRPNLWKCLKRFQSQAESICIWVDAICVNQDDIPERNQQIRLMSMIYSQADLVIAWLGDDPLDMLQALGPGHNQDYFEVPLMSFDWITLLNRRRREEFAKMHSAMSTLMRRGYWDRAWIVQELCLATEASVWFGKSGDLSLKSLQNWHRKRVVPKHRPKWAFNVLAPSAHSIMYLRNMKDYSGFEEDDLIQRDLPLLIYSFKDTRCSDARDTVYAFLSLARDGDSNRIMPDYTRTLDELCKNLLEVYPDNVYSTYVIDSIRYRAQFVDV